jgi:hypothetical protein
MNTHRLTLCLATIALAASLRAQAGPEPLGSESLQPGDLVVGEVRVNDKRIPLPAGQWQLAVRNERNPSVDGSRNLPPVQTLYLYEVQNGRLERTLEIAVSEYSGRVHWLDEPCKEKRDSYFVQVQEATYDTHFCTRIGFLSGVVEKTVGTPFQAWAERIRKDGIAYSTEMPFVLVVRYTRTSYLRMVMAFNPSVAGIESQPARNRAQSSWSPSGLEARPANIAFYQALQVWSPKYSESVRRAHAGDQSLRSEDYGLPQLARPTN